LAMNLYRNLYTVGGSFLQEPVSGCSPAKK
jgi:hypothetical protein